MKQMLILLAAVVLSTASLQAATPRIGDAAPNWTYLQGTDGKLHSRSDYKDAKAIVVVFLCNKCPCARGYDKRFDGFVKKYESQGIKLVAFNSNVGGIETMDDMKQRAVDGKYAFPYLKDASQKVGRSFGATSTPHAFVLDQDRRIVYSGAFDDNRSASLVKHHYVIDAIDAMLAGKAIPVTQSQQFGCAINYQ